MKINKDVIKNLNPCHDRYKNYLKYYGDKEFTPRQFMGLKNLTHRDKVWVAFRLLSEKESRLAAADIAESVIHIFEEKYPNDNRPRLAIQASRDLVHGRITDTAAVAEAEAVAAWATWAEWVEIRAAAMIGSAASTAVGLNHEKRIRTIILKYWK